MPRPSHRRFPAAVWPALLLLVLAVPVPVLAQAPPGRGSWPADVGLVSANAMAGGLTAAVTAWLRGKPVPRAFLQGAAGGTVVFAGKRVAVERFDGAGLLGREIAVLGSSIVANAGAGRGWADELWLVAGPVWVRTGWAAPPGLRVNLRDLGFIAWAATRPELRFDGAAALSNGTAFFRADGHYLRYDRDAVAGIALGTMVLLSAQAPGVEGIAGHEMVHVIQDDFLVHTWSRPIEGWGWRHLVGWSPPLDIGVLTSLRLLGQARDLEEYEADALAWRRGDLR